MAKPLRGNLTDGYYLIVGMLIKTFPRLYCLFIVLVVFSSNSLHAQITSDSDGNWNSPSTWQQEVIPSAPYDVEINSEVTIQAGTTAECDNLIINSTLIVEGTLIVYGNLESGNNSNIIANSGSSIFIIGDVNLANKISISLESYFVVKGNFTKSGASNQGNLTISGAHIYIFGEVTIPTDNNGIPWENFSVCVSDDYNGTTSSTGDDCDAGQLEDFIDNVDSEDLPDGIYDQLVDCDAPTATISGDASICEGEFTSISVDFIGAGPWEITTQRNGGDDVTVTNIDMNPYTFEVSQEGVYTVSAVSDANCTGTTSGSATVTVHPLPATSEIIPD